MAKKIYLLEIQSWNTDSSYVEAIAETEEKLVRYAEDVFGVDTTTDIGYNYYETVKNPFTQEYEEVKQRLFEEKTEGRGNLRPKILHTFTITGYYVI